MSRAIRRQVEGVEDVVEAAKLRDEWSRELLHDEGLSEERADSLAEGVDLLEDRYPEIMGLAVGEANDFARRQGKGKGREQKASKPAAASGGRRAQARANVIRRSSAPGPSSLARRSGAVFATAARRGCAAMREAPIGRPAFRERRRERRTCCSRSSA